MTTIPYFAFGSNLLTRRLQARVPSANSVGRAVLQDFRLAWHKVGADGSGKCDIVTEPGGRVWGVVFDIDPSEKPRLDAAEGLGAGYDERSVTVYLNGSGVEAATYQATNINRDLQPWHWYKDLVLAGALEHGLPRSYIQAIRETRALRDPDDTRRRRGESILTQPSTTERR
jgi:gamma-glutamylcyclotransferase